MLGFLSFPVTAANADPGIFKGVFYGFAFSKAENPLFVCGLLFLRAFWLTVSCGIETPYGASMAQLGGVWADGYSKHPEANMTPV